MPNKAALDRSSSSLGYARQPILAGYIQVPSPSPDFVRPFVWRTAAFFPARVASAVISNLSAPTRFETILIFHIAIVSRRARLGLARFGVI